MASVVPTAAATGYSNTAIWHQWVVPSVNFTTATNTYTVTNATAITSTEALWEKWRKSNRYTTTSTTLMWQDEVWNHWDRIVLTPEGRRQADDELQARREQQSRERLAAQQEQMENRLVAHSRALDLLDNLLTPEEQAYRDKHQKIQIEGSDGNLYWLEMHRETVHGNVVRTDEHGCLLGRACVAPSMYGDSGTLPTADGWVGQYLGLKFDAEQFLSHANWSGVRTCRLQQAAA